MDDRPSPSPSSPVVRDPGPAAVYQDRLARAEAEIAAGGLADERMGGLRLLLFVLALGLGGAALGGLVGGWWSLLPLVGFAVVVVHHGRLRARTARAERRARLYTRGLDRIADRWSGQGVTGEGWRPEHHPYADDLDLFGAGSLFQLLCRARTRTGEETLARWLLAPAPPEAVADRQDAVLGLAPRVDLREDLALAGEDVRAAADRDSVARWVAAPPRRIERLPPAVLTALGIATTVSFAAWAFGPWSPLLFLCLGAAQLLYTLPRARRVESVLSEAEHPSQDLALLAHLLWRFEEEEDREGLLGRLRRDLERDGRPASREIARLVRLMDFVDARRNQIFLPLSWLLALGTQLARRVEDWRVAHGADLARWVTVLGELEALVSLAAYAYEHPEDPMPTLDSAPGARIDAVALGHPLLPAATNVRNDVHLSAPPAPGAPQALVVSGSNMSGKSTLLRSLGVNVVLAQAGAPVRAGSLVLRPCGLGASIRVQDSLREGASRFYAEIARLKQVVDAAREARPVLFLLDEMLHGTNSHDRRVGAEAVLRTLLDAGAMGCVTTHDLALAQVAENDGRMENVHFEDRLEGDRILFDYRMRPGVVTRSNAIALMRAVGLDVTGPDEVGPPPSPAVS